MLTLETLELIAMTYIWASLVAQMVKESACNARELDSVHGLERSHGEGNGNPLQYSCLENPMDRGTWRAAGLAITKNRT